MNVLIVEHDVGQPYQITRYSYGVDTVEIFRIPSEQFVIPLLIQPYVDCQHLILLVLKAMNVEKSEFEMHSPCRRYSSMSIPT